MLEQLEVQNLALIDKLEISFSPGMNVLSGETGAGKSILIKAVNLLLGGKMGPDLLRQGTAELNVTALFSLPDPERWAAVLAPFGGAPGSELLVRRQIQQNGRSRVWINDHLTSLSALSQLTRLLISVSNQHETQNLLNPAQHLRWLDRFGGLEEEAEQVRRLFSRLEDSLRKWKELKDWERKREELQSLWRFQAEEIRQAHLIPDEEQEWRRRKAVLRQAEQIWEKIHRVQEILSDADISLIGLLDQAREALGPVAQIDPTLEPQVRELDQVEIQMQEVTLALREYMSALVFEPQALEEAEARLDLIQRLAAKYGPDTRAVLAHLDDLERRLAEQEERVEKLKELEQALEQERRLCFEVSADLSQKRRAAAQNLSRSMEAELRAVGLAECLFEVVFGAPPPDSGTDPHLTYGDKVLTPEGLERAEFYLAPNPGEGLRPLSRIASGGELSRILLVLMGLLSKESEVETIIFDEVDAGIGGGLGEQIGLKLKELARYHQILCVTHLPQIAVFAENHIRVTKKIRGQRTVTEMAVLNEKGRIQELARMLSGTAPSEPTLALAREYLERARQTVDS